MSIACAPDYEEVIYNVIKTEKKVQKKSPRYKSNYALKVNLNNKDKKPFGIMGPPELELPDPSRYLKKNSRKSATKKTGETTGRQCLAHEKRPPLPPVLETKSKKEVKEKNFIRNNVINAKQKKPITPEPKFVDTRTGTRQRVEKSGLEPHYVYSKKFGKPPNYLLRHVENKHKIMQAIKDKKDINTLSKCHYITRQERQNLLNGLKLNWEEMQKEYQLLPIITDTIPKILRKTKLENDLKQLEKDICLIEKHPYIYIDDDEE